MDTQPEQQEEQLGQEEAGEEEKPSPMLGMIMAFVGGALAIAAIRLEYFVVDFAACGCFVLAWQLSQALNQEDWPDHPLANKSTRSLLLVFAGLTGIIGALRLARVG